MLKNVTVKLVCLLVAILLWAQVAGHLEEERLVELPLTFVGLSDSLTVRTSATPERVWVRLRNNKLQLMLNELLQRDRGRVEVNLAGVGAGSYLHALTVRDLLVRATPVAVESPQSLNIQVYRLVTRQVSVRVVLEGSLSEGLILAGKPSVLPHQVEIAGPAPLVETMDYINTRPIKVSRRRKSFTETVALEPPDPGIRLLPVEVDVSMGIDEIVERSFPNVLPTIFRDDESRGVVVQPEFAQVRVTGPARAVEELRPQDVSVIIHIGDLPAGVHQLEPQVVVPGDNLSSAVDPPSFQVIVDGGEGETEDSG